MNERDPPAVRARSWRRIDQANSCLPQVLQRLVDIRNRVRDVVESLAALGEKASDGPFRIERSNQLDPRTARRKRRDFNTLLFQSESFALLEAKRPLSLERDVEISNHERDMMQRRVHSSQ